MNETSITKAKELMENGWRARENLELDKAQKLLNEAKTIFEKEEDWFNVTECLNHLAYTFKLMSKHALEEGMKLVESSEKMQVQYRTKRTSILRAKMSLLDSMGNFETSLTIACELLNDYTKPANQADVLSHIAMFQLRTGDIEGAMITINNAVKLIEEGWNDEKDPVRSIWKTKILMTKGLISYNIGDIETAKKLGDSALELAQALSLKTRISDARNFLALIDSNEIRWRRRRRY